MYIWPLSNIIIVNKLDLSFIELKIINNIHKINNIISIKILFVLNNNIDENIHSKILHNINIYLLNKILLSFLFIKVNIVYKIIQYKIYNEKILILVII